MSKELIERLLDNRVTGFNLTVAAVEAADLIEAQAAQIEVMRKALENIIEYEHGFCAHPDDLRDIAKEALSTTTPNEALQAFAEKVREYCAEICDEIGDCDNGYRCAKEIRAIKELTK